jgi:methyl-accepting chemotaxis protein
LEERVKLAANFVQGIERGELDVKFDHEDEQSLKSNDLLLGSLLNMRDQLKKFNSKESERKWVTEGFAKFVDILKSNTDSQELYDSIIVTLIKYLGANQGGLFIINDEAENNPFIELVAYYAYERKKYMEKRIAFGEGLIGQCVLEQETIYLTKVPQGYVEITSGLGHATPSSVILVPLKVNDVVHGVVEVASFVEIPGYQREFLEKVSENIASAIAGNKVKVKTDKLLSESREQSQRLLEQEEEMRQNVEELHATQEQMVRQEKELMENMESMIVSMQEEMVAKENGYLEEIAGLKEQLLINKIMK